MSFTITMKMTCKEWRAFPQQLQGVVRDEGFWGIVCLDRGGGL
jgi:hypothetical protein